MKVNREVASSAAHFCRILLLFVAVILIAVLSVYAAQNGGQNGPNNNRIDRRDTRVDREADRDSEGVEEDRDTKTLLNLSRFTDVPALLNAAEKAKADAQAILARTTRRDDREHLEKAIASLNAARSRGLTETSLNRFFNNVRQAVDAMEEVRPARIIAGNLAEASRVATEKFLANVARAIPRLSDTKTRVNATKDLAKSREDYARGVAAISAGRRGEAINQFRQAMKRMVGYPLRSGPSVKFIQTVLLTNPSQNPIHAVAFTPDGELTFVATFGELRFIKTGMTIPRSRAESFHFSDNGMYAVKRGPALRSPPGPNWQYGSSLTMYDSMGTVFCHRDTLPFGTQIRNDGKRIIVAAMGTDMPEGAVLMDGSGNIIQDLRIPFIPGDDGAISPGGLVAFSNNTITRILNTETGDSRISPVSGVAGFLTDGTIISGGGSGQISFVKASNIYGVTLWKTNLVSDGGRLVNISPDEKFIAVAQQESLSLLATDNGHVIWTLPLSEGFTPFFPVISNNANVVGISSFLPDKAQFFSADGNSIFTYVAQSDDFIPDGVNLFGIDHVNVFVSRDGTVAYVITDARIIRVDISQ